VGTGAVWLKLFSAMMAAAKSVEILFIIDIYSY